MSNTTSTAQAYEWVKTGHWSLRQFREWFDALAKKEQGQPVAWQWLTTAHFRKKLPKDAEKGAWNPLYTTPQQRTWVGLTNEEIATTADYFKDAYGFTQGVLWAEAKLKEKNT